MTTRLTSPAFMSGFAGEGVMRIELPPVELPAAEDAAGDVGEWMDRVAPACEELTDAGARVMANHDPKRLALRSANCRQRREVPPVKAPLVPYRVS